MNRPPDKEFKFNGKLAVITGSGTGIGQAIAKKFAENGSSIVLLGRRSEPLEMTMTELEKIIKRVGSAGRVRIFSGVDVSDEIAIEKMFSAIKADMGNVDILVNNAGVSGPVKTFTNSDFNEFKQCVAIHLTGTLWTSLKCIETMTAGAKVITISTFFTEENKYEQRPYRFRTPYTSSQGAKNRFAEALAWELVSKQIDSIATNPGPVHSDRIYKTVYPKAAAEFLRIGGFPGISSAEIDKISGKLLDLMGEDQDIVDKGIQVLSGDLGKLRGTDDSTTDSETNISSTLKGVLSKIQEIAEKIQSNTKKMIVDEEFLSQEQVADMVINLSLDGIGTLINGRVIPNDRVFYPVKPIIGTSVPAAKEITLENKVVIIIINSSLEKDHKRAKNIIGSLNGKIKQAIILTRHKEDLIHYRGLHSHSIDLSSEEAIVNIFKTAKAKFSAIDSVILLTGEFDYTKSLTSLSRNQLDKLVESYVLIPSLVTKQSVIAMAQEGAINEPLLFKNSKGTVVVIGPDSPVGDKISGLVRARSEVFRGALRPFNATVNQELKDVLGSSIRQYLLLGGNNEGRAPNEERIVASISNLISEAYISNNQTIFYPDET